MITITPEKNKNNILHPTESDSPKVDDNLFTTNDEVVNTANNLNISDMDIDTSYMSYDTCTSYSTSTTQQNNAPAYCNTNTVTPKRVSFRDVLVHGTSSTPIPIKQGTSMNLRNLQVISSQHQNITEKSQQTVREIPNPQGIISTPQVTHLIDNTGSTRTNESIRVLNNNIQNDEVKRSTSTFDNENTINNK